MWHIVENNPVATAPPNMQLKPVVTSFLLRRRRDFSAGYTGVRRMVRVTGGPAIEVYRAGLEDSAIVENLLDFYTYEFSESAQIDIGPDGRFGYEDLTDYWNLDGLHPYLMSIGSKLSGLSLVQRGSVITGSKQVWDMEEFFVMRKYRRRG